MNEEWHVVTEDVHGEDDEGLTAAEKGDNQPLGKTRQLQFNESQHKSLNPELKYLYTAITRAKYNLWIYDSDKSKRLPMFDYWYRRHLIKAIKVSDIDEQDQLTLFASPSTPEEWKLQGDYFKKKKLWDASTKCYHKANCVDLGSEALGYSLVQHARQLNLKLQEKIEIFIRAALAFLESDKLLENSAKCLKNAKRHGEAAILFFSLGQVSLKLIFVDNLYIYFICCGLE